MVPGVTVDGNTININGNNVTLTLSWGEPIVNYGVSCSGDVTCPPNFTTSDNTTRSYTITNLTPMTSYAFSVVATNSIGSGEAGVVMITTPGKVTDAYVYVTWHEKTGLMYTKYISLYDGTYLLCCLSSENCIRFPMKCCINGGNVIRLLFLSAKLLKIEIQNYGQILCAHKPYFLMPSHICV